MATISQNFSFTSFTCQGFNPTCKALLLLLIIILSAMEVTIILETQQFEIYSNWAKLVQFIRFVSVH